MSDKYKNLLHNLSPTGEIWNREKGSNLDNLYTAIAEELQRLDIRITDLIKDANPLTVFEMLVKREEEAGIPDACETLGETLQERRNRLVSQWSTTGGASKQYFLDLATAQGESLTITEFTAMTCEDDCEDQLYDESWHTTVEFGLSDKTPIFFRAGVSQAGDRLMSLSEGALECILSKVKPAHVNAIFTSA